MMTGCITRREKGGDTQSLLTCEAVFGGQECFIAKPSRLARSRLRECLTHTCQMYALLRQTGPHPWLAYCRS
jgi:hypothetical protein